MKKILLFLFLCSTSVLLSQIKVDGLLSINEFYGKVVSNFDGEHFWVKHNSKYNIYDTKGKLIYKDIVVKSHIDVRDYQNSFNIKEGVFVAYDKTKLKEGFISLPLKNQLSDFVFSTLISYDNGTYFAIKELAKAKPEYLYLDKDLNTIYKIKPERIIAIQKESIGGLISDEKRRRLFGSVNDGLIKNYNPATKKFGFSNTDGKLIIPHSYKAVGDFSGGLAFFQNDDKLYGYIDTKGEIVIPAKYSKQPYSFFNDRAKVLSKDGLWGFIDGSNQLVIDTKYKYASNFYKNHALVREDQFSPIMLIDSSGKVLTSFDKDLKIDFQEQANIHQTLGLNAEYFTHINPVLKQLVDFKKGIFTHKNNKSGLVDSNGNTVLDFKYKSLKDYNDGLLLAIITDENYKEKHGLINEQGEFIVEVAQSKF